MNDNRRLNNITHSIYENGGDFTQLLQGDTSLTVIYGGTKLGNYITTVTCESSANGGVKSHRLSGL